MIPDPHLRLHTAVWQVARNEVLDCGFQEKTIAPVARDLANDFMMTMTEKFEKLGAKVPAGMDAKPFWDRRTKDVEGIFLKALILKGLMMVAPDYYYCFWPISGSELNRDRMEELYANDGIRMVMWCVTPGFKVRSTKESEAEVACHAKVVTRAKDEKGEGAR